MVGWTRGISLSGWGSTFERKDLVEDIIARKIPNVPNPEAAPLPNMLQFVIENLINELVLSNS